MSCSVNKKKKTSLSITREQLYKIHGRLTTQTVRMSGPLMTYFRGRNGIDRVLTTLCARQREAKFSVKTLNNLNANIDVENAYALAA